MYGTAFFFRDFRVGWVKFVHNDEVLRALSSLAYPFYTTQYRSNVGTIELFTRFVPIKMSETDNGHIVKTDINISPAHQLIWI